ncbi:MAG: winged helix-turn-helix transcriptional regulator [Planctomycetes bacterium]|nr:winged helix-turn-helix transcriptional regulator [Planctomycetota bacterium]
MAAKKPLSPEFIEHIARRFRTLGDTTRLTLIQSLMGGPKAVGDIVAATGKTQANVSKHLALLADEGIVSRQRDGNHIIYEVADPVVFQLCDLVCGSVRNRLTREVKENERLLRSK